jgi:heterodisulfide reductase subunit A-like polyferredoxin
MTTTSKDHKGKHALVIGASMGGLPAARTLSDTFEKVTILEQFYLCIGILLFGVSGLPTKDWRTP